MKYNKLNTALDEINDQFIAEAAEHKRKRKFYWLGAIAAVLAIVLLMQLPGLPMAVHAQQISAASGSRAAVRPNYDVYKDKDAWRTDYDAWSTQRDQQQAAAASALNTVTPFFARSTQLYMTGAGGKNRVWSPINAFIALGMLAEVTSGDSRQQILDLLGVSGLDTLRTHVSAVWEEVYTDNGNEICVLANSLWLNEDLNYNQEAMDSLAHYYYTSIYQSDLSSNQAADSLRAWLNNNTGGLLKDRTQAASFPPEAVLTLASTVYLQAKWSNEFSAGNNTDGMFHTPDGDTQVTYMNKKLMQTNYYWGDSFGAVALGLKNGTQMWFFLPDEGKTPDDILADGQYLEVLRSTSAEAEENSKYMKVNLSVPKFDIASGADLKEMFRELGVTDIFNEKYSDFTAITSDSPVCVTAVNQAARVIIDEQGVKAASYIEIPGAGAAAPPEDIIDFILDRPFLFVIADYNGIPLFTGLVNDP